MRPLAIYTQKTTMFKHLFSFPDPVNETSARLVAGGVLLMAACYVAFRPSWLLAVIALGFWARVLTGPTLSPLGRIAVDVVTPRLKGPHRYCPGPPKRFAQAIGALFSTAALALAISGYASAACALMAMLAAFAALEAVMGLCVGCKIFNMGIRLGLVPDSVCERCASLEFK